MPVAPPVLTLKQTTPCVWVVGDKLGLHILGGAPGELAGDGINGAARRGFSAKTGEFLQDSVSSISR